MIRTIVSEVTEIQNLGRQIRKRALPLENLEIEIDRIRQAAVTILLREHLAEVELLIIQRAVYPNDPWSGHLALPGGRADAADQHLIATAARETFEEVGIRLNPEQHYIGRLATLLPQNPRLPKIEISPLIAIAPETFSMQLSDEVADAFWMPLRGLKQHGLSDFYRWKMDEVVIKYPAYSSPRGPIWGITQKILTDFLLLLD